MASSTNRFLSGTLASWARIGVTMISQLALVPLFLTYWRIEVYGIWIALQALINVVSTFDRGFMDYLAYEFIKIGTNKSKKLSYVLGSALLTAFIFSCVELLLVLLLFYFIPIEKFFGSSRSMIPLTENSVIISFVILWIGWILSYYISLISRTLLPFGYFPRAGWFNVLLAVVNAVSTIIAVMLGSGLILVSCVNVAGSIVVLGIQYFDLQKRLIKEGIVVKLNHFGTIKRCFLIGLKYFLTSLGLSGRYFLENFRQQGVRLLLAPLVGAAGLAAFSTMRTGANIALQGLGTITNPIMPELLRYLHAGDQDKTEGAFDIIWIVLLAGLAPGVLLIQAVAPKLFAIWTKGQIPFDPLLFASLSLGVLVYAWAQSPGAVVTGNNLIRPQLVISILASTIVIGGMFILMPSLGIIGAGLALLLAEVVSALGFYFYARKWLINHTLKWPARPAQLSSLSILIAGLGMVFLVFLPQFKLVILFVALLLFCLNTWFYWKSMPLVATNNAIAILNRIPGINIIAKA